MAHRRRIGAALVIAGLTLGVASAELLGQPSGQRGPGRQGQQGGRPQMPKLLGEDAPKVGDALPEVELFTATGDEFRTSQLKGKYTVIVFGCLT